MVLIYTFSFQKIRLKQWRVFDHVIEIRNNRAGCEFHTACSINGKTLFAPEQFAIFKCVHLKLFCAYSKFECACTSIHHRAISSHNDVDGFVRLNLVAFNVEVYFHNYTLQGYSCILWVWTCDPGCIVEQFMISISFPPVHDKHLQTSPELTTMTAYRERVLFFFKWE